MLVRVAVDTFKNYLPLRVCVFFVHITGEQDEDNPLKQEHFAVANIYGGLGEDTRETLLKEGVILCSHQ